MEQPVKNRLQAGENDEKGKMYFGDAAKLWLMSVKAKTKESTYAQYSLIVSNHVERMLGKCLIENINRPMIEQIVQNLLISGRKDGEGGLSSKTVSDILVVIKSILEYAAQIGFQTPSSIKGISVRKRSKEIHVISEEDEWKLLNVLFTETDRYKLGVIICLWTGIRIGELCALQWKDVILEKQILNIGSTLQRIVNFDSSATDKTKVIITSPKSQSSIRSIPLPAVLLCVLKQFAADPNAYVLSGSSENYIEPRTMQYHFRKYLDESGIKRTNFHSLRHTFATHCVEAGVDIKCLSEILGHATVNITMNRYVHTSINLKMQEMNKFSLRYDCIPKSFLIGQCV